jgi:hypothetical protein
MEPAALEMGKGPRAQLNRWGIAVAGVIVQIALGAVYVWSIFRIEPLVVRFPGSHLPLRSPS